MAQLNPNFEIDFNDINSYEQIQLINDTQLAKENLLMHKAYKEPAEDEIIRNQFSSFTFVDFCPKLFTINSNVTRASSSRPASSARMASDQADSHTQHHDTLNNNNNNNNNNSKPAMGSKLLRYQNYELETFSDLFDRINAWLKLNKDWRVVSMETLLFDCTSQFNHLKSSVHSSYLPRNMRGLRLYLSPSKSRFSAPQKIGCINVVPRKLSGQYKVSGGGGGGGGGSQNDANSQEPLEYETLDQILARLNELLLTRPIEGRILSVETLTLPIANGYVNTETNYFMDSRLNLLNQRIYSHANNYQAAGFAECAEAEQRARSSPPAAAQQGDSQPPAAAVAAAASCRARHQSKQHAHGLVDVLRVYYEFGPIICGLVNLIDFLPHFHRQTRLMTAREPHAQDENVGESSDQLKQEQQVHEIDANETLTRLVRRSLAWFEEERKRILHETGGATGECVESVEQSASKFPQTINLKLCNLQIHRKLLLKSQLAALTPQNVFETIQTGRMFHEPPQNPIVCTRCSLSSQTHPAQDWCQHLIDLNEPFELKFVRLAYVVPVDSRQVASRMAALRAPQVGIALRQPARHQAGRVESPNGDDELELERVARHELLECSSPESISRAEAPISELEVAEKSEEEEEAKEDDDDEDDELEEEDEELESSSSESSSEDEVDELVDDLHVLEGIFGRASGELDVEELAKEASLALVHETSRRQAASERAHQLGDEPDEHEQSNSMIGQLTYRLFAPCQLVNSSSCFSINPVNSSSPLSRRGSVNLSGATTSMHSAALSLSSENATPSTLLLPPAGSSSALASVSESNASLNQTIPLTPPIQSQQQVISFGAFFPALSHEIILTGAQLSPFGSGSSGGGGGGDKSKSSTSGAHFTTNEFESVEAIRRRMEIYVTTNSMKVLAGETLIVNLSDQLSCLSTAIEQTIVRASFVAQRPPSSWVSVYVLYAAVDEPHLPGQLLEQQRLREQLALINEEDEDSTAQVRSGPLAPPAAVEVTRAGAKELEGGQDNMLPVFDDDFKSVAEQSTQTTGAQSRKRSNLKLTIEPQQQQQQQQQQQEEAAVAPPPPSQSVANNKTSASSQLDGSIRVDLERVNRQPGSCSLYNSAYDRTVALPTQPDNHLSDYLEPVDFNLNPAQLADSLWLEEGAELSSLCAGSHQHEPISLTSVSVQAAQRQMRLRQRQGRSAISGGGGRQKKQPTAGEAKTRSSAASKRNKSARGQHSQCSLI